VLVSGLQDNERMQDTKDADEIKKVNTLEMPSYKAEVTHRAG
jgi:hypothetical protein